MNENELRKNKSLTEYVVHDLNKNQKLPFDDDTFDVVLNTVSVDYMTSPFQVFEDVGRVLKPGGLFLVIFSNRWFPKKAVKIWKESTEEERMDLVYEYFNRSDLFDGPNEFISMGKPRPKDDKYTSLGVPSDPIYAVYADKKGLNEKNGKRQHSDLSVCESVDKDELEKRKKEIKNTLRCPHCEEKMKKWMVPDNPFIEWNNEYMYICFNDACPYLVRGWKTMYTQGNMGLSYRLMYNPENDYTTPAPIHTLNDLRDGIAE